MTVPAPAPDFDLVKAVDSLRTRFGDKDVSSSTAYDILQACGRVSRDPGVSLSFLVEVAARDDNPCWLPHEVFEDVQALVSHCSGSMLLGIVTGAASNHRSAIRWSPYRVDHF